MLQKGVAKSGGKFMKLGYAGIDGSRNVLRKR
jgi:hypothetical protein